MKKIIASLIAFSPILAFAQINSTQQVTDFNTLTVKLTQIGNVIIEILIAFAVIWIIFNVVRFILGANDPEKRGEYRSAVLWGIVGLFVILSIWGLVRILTNTFRTDTRAPRQSTGEVPRLEVPGR
ncbi:MAG: pilin [bacterium]|nr:pilin [bacterium]